MPEKILLINVNQCSFPYPIFPLGMAHCAAALKDAGFETQLCDLQYDGTDIEKAISGYAPDYIGLSLRNIDNVNSLGLEFFVPALAGIVNTIKMCSRVPLILGGSGYSLFPDKLLEMTGADFGIWGEAELSFPLLLKCIGSGESYEHIPGLVFRNGSIVVTNPKKPCPPGQIPALRRPQGLARYYINQSTMLNIQTQRGCSYNCCYCTYPLIEGTTFRYRSPQVVCDEIADAKECGARYFFIVDSVFNTSQEHVRAICEEMIRRELDMQWGCFLRPKNIDRTLMDLMRKAGLTHIEYGTDSLCDSVLEAYGKAFAVDDVVHASECARNAGVRYAHFLIFGGPTETEQTVQESLSNSTRIKKTVFFPFIGMRLYPGTPLHAFAIRQGEISAQQLLLEPKFYVSARVSHEKIRELLLQHQLRHQNWVVGDLPPSLQKVMAELRTIGVVGPLWEFLIQ